MLSRRALALAFVALPVAVRAFAAEKVDFSAAAFDAAQKAGKPILVEIHATWCPTCKAQTPILSKLEAEPKYAGLEVFHVDFELAEGSRAPLRGAHAEHADRVQGRSRDRPLGRRHQRGFNRGAAV